MRKSFRTSSVLLLGGLFMAGLQACTKSELPLPNAPQATSKATGVSMIAERSFRSVATGQSSSYLSLALANSPIFSFATTTAVKVGMSRVVDTHLPEVTTNLMDGSGGSGCYEITDVYYNLDTGEEIGREIVGYTGNCSGGGGGGGDEPMPPSYPTGGGGGGSSPTGGIASQPGNTDPCQTNATLAANTQHTQLAGLLKNGVNLNYETGYTYGQYNGNIRAVGLAGAPGESEIGTVQLPMSDIAQVPVPLDGIMHTHTPGLLPIFSVVDLASIASLYHQGNIRSASTFTAELYTAAGTTYMLTISDPSLLVAFDNSLRGSSRSVVLDAYEKSYSSYGIGASNSSASQNEQGLAKMLAELKIGLQLSKPDPARPGKSIKLGIDTNGQLTTTACN